MIYQLVNSVVVPGKMAEYYDIATKELMPLYPKLGMKLAGSFRPYTGNMNEIYSIYAWDNLAAFQKTREAQQTDKDFQKVSVKLNALRVSLTQTLLEPNAWSPMK
jgi:hypothetical protein